MRVKPFSWFIPAFAGIHARTTWKWSRRPAHSFGDLEPMIIRIRTEGQYNLSGQFLDDLNDLDNKLVDIIAQEDRDGFETALKEMLDLVRNNGEAVPIDELVESDVVLPEPDLTLEEAEELFVGEGLVPD